MITERKKEREAHIFVVVVAPESLRSGRAVVRSGSVVAAVVVEAVELVLGLRGKAKVAERGVISKGENGGEGGRRGGRDAKCESICVREASEGKGGKKKCGTTYLRGRMPPKSSPEESSHGIPAGNDATTAPERTPQRGYGCRGSCA